MSHAWRPTGKSRLVTVETTRGNGGIVRWSFVRCERCRSVGFRRDSSPVIYTWEQAA